MKSQTLPIVGMHCRSCEILISDHLLAVPGIKKALVNHTSGTAQIFYKTLPSSGLVSQAIKKAGYRLGQENLSLISHRRQDYQELLPALIVTLLLILVLRQSGIFSQPALSGNFGSLGAVLLIGLTAGVSTCMALVGGLILAASAKYAALHPASSGFSKFQPHIWFNLGRILSYFILGGLIGWLGSALQISDSFIGFLIVIAAFAMLLLGVQLLEIFPLLKRLSFTLPSGLSRFLPLKKTAGYSHSGTALAGAATFFLPCGFTQALQIYAISTGSALSGALTMGVFALGTAPGLLGLGGLTSAVKGKFSRIFFKTAGFVVIALALFNLRNGLGLLGLTPIISQSRTSDAFVNLENGVQIVSMRQVANGYVPNKFTLRKGMPVRWIISSENSYSCAAALSAPLLGVRQLLVRGENIIEFTPQETGTIPFSCSMGMYRGSFTVI